MLKNFDEIKAEILLRAKKTKACDKEFKRAENAESYSELIRVITDNFYFSCFNKIIDVPMLENIGKDICNENNLFFNVSTDKGYLIVDSATVRAWGSATVEVYGSATVDASDSATVRASGSATVRAWGSATVRASGSAIVRAWDSATVEASGSAYINSYNSIEHKISDKTILRYFYENRVVLADENSFKPIKNASDEKR